LSPGLPEQQARVEIDKALDAAGWLIQDRDELNLTAGRGVAVREFKMADGHGFADYLLFVEGPTPRQLERRGPHGVKLVQHDVRQPSLRADLASQHIEAHGVEYQLVQQR
jgi:hypothetical protein